MKWKGRRESSNVEDRRGGRAGGKAAIGGGLGLVIAIIVLLMGGDPGAFLGGQQQDTTVPYESTVQEEELADYVSVVLADTEDVWTDLFAEYNMEYEKPTLVLFTDQVQSACGVAGASTGPFYCPGDRNLYIDLSFAQELENRFKAPGEFAMAYVIAHEVGHHVQTLLGITDQLDKVRGTVSQEEYNQYSVRFELQADYFAGVWAKHVQGKGYLEPGDIDEALTAASAIGDDTIQKQSMGYTVPDSFTHGTSEQRKRWFERGFKYGTITDGDTFGVPNP